MAEQYPTTSVNLLDSRHLCRDAIERRLIGGTTDRNGSFCDHTGMDDDRLADFLLAYAEVCAEAGIDPLATDALAVLAEAMLAAGVTCQ